MELSPEGLAAAAATRQAAKKRSQSEDKPAANGADGATNPAAAQAGAKRQQGLGGRPPATCTHEVAIPEGYDEAAAAEKLDPAVHGALPGAPREGKQRRAACQRRAGGPELHGLCLHGWCRGRARVPYYNM
jgi:hypothetical protein